MKDRPGCNKCKKKIIGPVAATVACYKCPRLFHYNCADSLQAGKPNSTGIVESNSSDATDKADSPNATDNALNSDMECDITKGGFAEKSTQEKLVSQRVPQAVSQTYNSQLVVPPTVTQQIPVPQTSIYQINLHTTVSQTLSSPTLQTVVSQCHDLQTLVALTPVSQMAFPKNSDPFVTDTTVFQTAVPQILVPQTEVCVSKTSNLHTTVTHTTVSQISASKSLVPQTPICQTTVSQTSVPHQALAPHNTEITVHETPQCVSQLMVPQVEQKLRSSSEVLLALANAAAADDLTTSTFKSLSTAFNMTEHILKETWSKFRHVCMLKLRALAGLSNCPEGMDLSPEEWAVCDYELKRQHERAVWLVLNTCSTPLRLLVRLVQQYQLEAVGIREVRLQRWASALKHYRDSGLSSSLLVLQRIWWELKMETRCRVGAYCRGARIAPPDLLRTVARLYPYIVTRPLAGWRACLQSGAVLVASDQELRRVRLLQPAPIPDDAELPVAETGPVAPEAATVSRRHQLHDQLRRDLSELKKLYSLHNLDVDEPEETIEARAAPNSQEAQAKPETQTGLKRRAIYDKKSLLESVKRSANWKSFTEPQSKPHQSKIVNDASGSVVEDKAAEDSAVEDSMALLLSIDPKTAQTCIIFESDDDDDLKIVDACTNAIHISDDSSNDRISFENRSTMEETATESKNVGTLNKTTEIPCYSTGSSETTNINVSVKPNYHPDVKLELSLNDDTNTMDISVVNTRPVRNNASRAISDEDFSYIKDCSSIVKNNSTLINDTRNEIGHVNDIISTDVKKYYNVQNNIASNKQKNDIICFENRSAMYETAINSKNVEIPKSITKFPSHSTDSFISSTTNAKNITEIPRREIVKNSYINTKEINTKAIDKCKQMDVDIVLPDPNRIPKVEANETADIFVSKPTESNDENVANSKNIDEANAIDEAYIPVENIINKIIANYFGKAPTEMSTPLTIFENMELDTPVPEAKARSEGTIVKEESENVSKCRNSQNQDLYLKYSKTVDALENPEISNAINTPELHESCSKTSNMNENVRINQRMSSVSKESQSTDEDMEFLKNIVTNLKANSANHGIEDSTKSSDPKLAMIPYVPLVRIHKTSIWANFEGNSINLRGADISSFKNFYKHNLNVEPSVDQKLESLKKLWDRPTPLTRQAHLLEGLCRPASVRLERLPRHVLAQYGAGVSLANDDDYDCDNPVDQDVMPSTAELQNVLALLAVEAPEGRPVRAYCCKARRHRALNEARRRRAISRGTYYILENDYHGMYHSGRECKCCCRELLRDAPVAPPALQRMQQKILYDLDVTLGHKPGKAANSKKKSIAEENVKSTDDQRGDDYQPPKKNPKTQTQQKKSKQNEKNKALREKRLKQREGEPLDDLSEWVRQKNITQRFFNIAPRAPAPPPPPRPSVITTIKETTAKTGQTIVTCSHSEKQHPDARADDASPNDNVVRIVQHVINTNDVTKLKTAKDFANVNTKDNDTNVTGIIEANKDTKSRKIKQDHRYTGSSRQTQNSLNTSNVTPPLNNTKISPATLKAKLKFQTSDKKIPKQRYSNFKPVSKNQYLNAKGSSETFINPNKPNQVFVNSENLRKTQFKNQSNKPVIINPNQLNRTFIRANPNQMYVNDKNQLFYDPTGQFNQNVVKDRKGNQSAVNIGNQNVVNIGNQSTVNIGNQCAQETNFMMIYPQQKQGDQAGSAPTLVVLSVPISINQPQVLSRDVNVQNLDLKAKSDGVRSLDKDTIYQEGFRQKMVDNVTQMTSENVPQALAEPQLPIISSVLSLASPDDDSVIMENKQTYTAKPNRAFVHEFISPSELFPARARHVTNLVRGAPFALLRLNKKQLLWHLPTGHILVSEALLPCRSARYYLINSKHKPGRVRFSERSPSQAGGARATARIKVKSFAKMPAEAPEAAEESDDEVELLYDLVTANNKLYKRLSYRPPLYARVLCAMPDVACAERVCARGFKMFAYSARDDALEPIELVAPHMLSAGNKELTQYIVNNFNNLLPEGAATWSLAKP